MWMTKCVVLAVGLLLGSSVYAEKTSPTSKALPPICYKDFANNREVILHGVNHAGEIDRHDILVEALVDQATAVLFENTALFSENGIYEKQADVSKELAQAIRLDSIVDPKHIPELSKMLGMPLSRESPIFLVTIPSIVSGIVYRKLLATGQIEKPIASPWEKIVGIPTVETVAYAHALRKLKPVLDLESVKESVGLPELNEVKKAISEAFECVKHIWCMDAFRENSLLLADHLSNPSGSYEEIFQVAMRIPDTLRATLAQRNQRMFRKIMRSISHGSRALVIVGATHIGGPVGLSSKFVAAKFARVKCVP